MSKCQGRGMCACKTEPITDQDPGDETFRPFPTGAEAVRRLGRLFGTGAYRDGDSDKLDYEGFFSPRVLTRRAEYMHKHRVQSNGEMRDSDNWQLGIPMDQYMKSAFRHWMELWNLWRLSERHPEATEFMEEALCALMFNCEGMLFEMLREA